MMLPRLSQSLRLSRGLCRPGLAPRWAAAHRHLSLQGGGGGFVVSPAVREALAARQAVVALESTIITHGLPFPHNLDTAVRVEEAVREEGAVAATVGVLKGRVHVGLTQDQLQELATNKECVKVSRRDLPYVLAKGMTGGTTVSGTMVVAGRAGIHVFVTGGIGGVHRGAKTTMDVSADLTELGRTPVTVVCAGVKSILDVGRTLEYLETEGVCVSVLGPDARFPDFFTRDSGFLAPSRVESPAEAALMMQRRAELRLEGGLLVAVPIPEQHQAEGRLIKEAIDQAVREAAAAGVLGRDVTPFVLNRVSEITAGRSLQSNIALILNNAKVGAQIAVEYARLTAPASTSSSFTPPLQKGTTNGQDDDSSSRPVVVGGCIVDFVVTVLEPKLEFTGRTHQGAVTQSYGGVGRNLADALARLHCRPFLVSAVGDDSHARALIAHNPDLQCAGLRVVSGSSTSVYSVLLDHRGEALLGVGNMDVHQHISPEYVQQFEQQFRQAPLVVVDGNLSQRTVNYVLDLCSAARVAVWYEPTDVKKATKPWRERRGHAVTFASPNLNELRAICSFLGLGEVGEAPTGREEDVPRFVRDVLGIAAPLLLGGRALMVTMGPLGFMILRRAPAGEEDAPLLPVGSSPAVDDAEPAGLFFPGLAAAHVTSVSGAGDCLAAGFMANMLQGHRVRRCGAAALAAASLSLAARPAVPDTLSPAVLDAEHAHYVLVRL